mmetsp:Transcript_81374/g.186154  ORF Transcript_81374/g.186154 Transcript_81374/m.186154 type:complete len:230 (+) Transcript_81374:2320-3009(+)
MNIKRVVYELRQVADQERSREQTIHNDLLKSQHQQNGQGEDVVQDCWDSTHDGSPAHVVGARKLLHPDHEKHDSQNTSASLGTTEPHVQECVELGNPYLLRNILAHRKIKLHDPDPNGEHREEIGEVQHGHFPTQRWFAAVLGLRPQHVRGVHLRESIGPVLLLQSEDSVGLHESKRDPTKGGINQLHKSRTAGSAVACRSGGPLPDFHPRKLQLDELKETQNDDGEGG